MGGGTNNFGEFMALKYLLKIALDKGHEQLQVFGESLSVIIGWTTTLDLEHYIYSPS